MERLPPRLRNQWMPFRTTEILYCLTMAEDLDRVLHEGLVPRLGYFPDLRSVILAYSMDPLYEPVYRFAVEGFRRQGHDVVRLHVSTGNVIYRSLLPNRTYEIMSLDAITPTDIASIEHLRRRQ